MSQQRPRYHSIPLRTSAPKQTRTTVQKPVQTISPLKRESYVSSANLPAMPTEDQVFALTRLPTSTVRYRDTEGNPVFQQGNQRVVVRYAKPRRRARWLLFTGFGMLVMLGLFVGLNAVGNWWQAHQLDSQYGYPRFYQVDAVTGIDHDSPAHPSHFIFENLSGHIIFIDIPAGDIRRVRRILVIRISLKNLLVAPLALLP